jgi:preprotein translocase subunit SecE
MVTVGGSFIFFYTAPTRLLLSSIVLFSFVSLVIAELGDIFYPFQHPLTRYTIRLIRLVHLITVIVATLYAEQPAD